MAGGGTVPEHFLLAIVLKKRLLGAAEEARPRSYLNRTGAPAHGDATP